MKIISKSENRKVTLLGIDQGHLIIEEAESYERNGHKWDKVKITLTSDELRKLLAKFEEAKP